MSGINKRRRSRRISRIEDTRTLQSRGPPIRIVKRDGRIEEFNRIKMINSIRSAGATQEEANLVTSRVSNRMTRRESLPSKEVSHMVTRSLSHVNPTASRNYADRRDRKLAYDNRVNQLSSEISSINQQVNLAANRIDNLDSQIQGLAGRISRIRQGNYRVLTHLETKQASLSETWASLSPGLRNQVSTKAEIIRSHTQDLQQSLMSKMGDSSYNLNNLQDIESAIPGLRLNLSEVQNSVVSELSSIEKAYEEINKDLTSAERTLSIVNGASFAWEEGETPILAIKAKDLNNDHEGYITLTNHRFVFEHEKEIALKKTLFIVTEKKIVRETNVEKPIGMVVRLAQGKVGFFKGAGLFVEFASEAGLPEMKFDTSSQDADWAINSYNYVLSGQAEKELDLAAPDVAKEKETLQLISCPVCGAPYKEKVYRGQTSVNCKYCGSIISLKH
ncbi:MAG: hypothetical protein JW815_04755 [Candidatus Bathyarchaeota archaeon]|nr:hypothetical protein [Candidatus Bathyarchaeum sp.]